MIKKCVNEFGKLTIDAYNENGRYLTGEISSSGNIVVWNVTFGNRLEKKVPYENDIQFENVMRKCIGDPLISESETKKTVEETKTESTETETTVEDTPKTKTKKTKKNAEKK